MSELADEADSKSVDGNIVRVRPPLPALQNPSKIGRSQDLKSYFCYFFESDEHIMPAFSIISLFNAISETS